MITIRLVAPDTLGRLLWVSLDAAVAHFEPDGDARVAFAALGLCLGWPIPPGLDLLVYGDWVGRALAPRMDAEQIGHAAMRAMDMLRAPADAQAPSTSAPNAPASAPDLHATIAEQAGVLPPPPPGASTADVGLYHRALARPEHAAAWLARVAELGADAPG